MTKRTFASSELMINTDGSIFHLHLKPTEIADKIILVGDPARVEAVAQHFTTREIVAGNREFRTVTGAYKGKRITVQSTGIGCDNIDIVITELDALANINLEKREEKEERKSLTFVRIGTCGSLQPNISTGMYIASKKSIGFDGLLNFYAKRDEVCDLDLEEKFKHHMDWHPRLADPYIVDNDSDLLERIASNDMTQGITVSCGGFYGPQGRELRLAPYDRYQNEKLQSFKYKGLYITNIEMESSAVAGLSLMLGHKALTCCMAIADRFGKNADTEYKERINQLITLVLDRI